MVARVLPSCQNGLPGCQNEGTKPAQWQLRGTKGPAAEGVAHKTTWARLNEIVWLGSSGFNRKLGNQFDEVTCLRVYYWDT